MKTYKILDLLDTQKAISKMMEYASYKNEKDNTQLEDLQSVVAYLKPDNIYSCSTEKVLPYTIDGEWFICAAEESNTNIIQEAIDFIDDHENMKGLHVITPEEEFGGTFINSPKLIVDGKTWVEAKA